MALRLLTFLALLIGDAAALASKVAVIGATGKVGRLAVQQLVSQGYTARVLLRKEVGAGAASTGMPPTVDAEVDDVYAWYASSPSGIERVVGDVTDRDSLETLLEGCSAVLALHGARRTRKLKDFLPWADPTLDPEHAKNINYEGVRNLIAAARASKLCKRIVRITGKGETPWSIFSILINGLGSMAKAWNYEGENLLRACDDLQYTIIRPGIMKGDEGDLPKASLALADDGGDLKVSAIPHASIARLCVESLRFPNAGRSTLTAMTTAEPGEGSDDWTSALKAVKTDRRAFRDDLLAEHFRAVRMGGTALVAALSVITGALAMLVKVAVVALAKLVLR
jgi:NAD(P)-dependent dehydrogenase (short-subunit alcohol dehydrogenase family)